MEYKILGNYIKDKDLEILNKYFLDVIKNAFRYSFSCIFYKVIYNYIYVKLFVFLQ